MRNLVVRFDWAIKRLLRNKANFVVLEGFLSTLLGRTIKINRILESEGNQEKYDDKFNRVDLLAEDESGELMIFEVQNDRELDFFHRMLYGASKVVSEYINKGDAYKKVRKVYSINIVYFSLGVGNDYVYHGRTEFFGINHPNEKLRLTPKQKSLFQVEEVGDIFPEFYLLRVENFDSVAKSPLDEWISYLKSGVIEERFSAAGLGEARTLLKYDAMDEKSRAEYDAHMENVRYQRSVISSNYDLGKLDGRTLERYETVQRLKNKGRTMEQVADNIDISLDEVRKYWDCQP